MAARMLSLEELDTPLIYLPVFARPGFTAGEWVNRPGHVPYFRYNEQVDAFRHALSLGSFLLYSGWQDGDETVRQADKDPAFIADAPW